MRITLLTTFLIITATSFAHAEPASPNAARAAEKFNSLSHDEKKAVVEKNMDRRAERREEMKKKWDSMTPEEKTKVKAEAKERRAERKEKREERLSNMTPEERAIAEKNAAERKTLRQEIRKENNTHQ